MAEIQLLDHLGRPIVKQVLTQRLAGPTIAGVRRPNTDMVTRGLTPQRLARILSEAEDGNPEAYMSLAEEMEEKDLHYLSVLGTRKRQVAQLDMVVNAPSHSNDPTDKKAAQLVQEELVDSGVLQRAIFDMMDAIGKGFSLCEIIWQCNANLWRIDRLEYVDPHFVRFDLLSKQVPLLLGDNGWPEELPPYKFVYHQMKAKSGVPLRSLARVVAWSFLFKNYSIKDWVQFCEIYGLPLRLGKFTPGASEDDKDALLEAIRPIAIDAAGIIPSTMEIQFVETAQKGSTADLYKLLCDYCDQQVSKAVLGQTATTDAIAGGHAVSQEHNMVREDIERADAKVLMETIAAQITKPFVDLNLGPRLRYPMVVIGRPETVDAELMLLAAEKLVPLGLRVRQKDIRKNVGFTEPQQDDELLTPPAAPPPMGAPANPLALPPHGPTDATKMLAAFAAGQVADADAIERAVNDQLGDWHELVGPIAAQIEEVGRQSKTPDEFKALLAKLYPTLNVTPLGNRLTSLAFQSLAGGYAGDTLQKHQRAIAAAGGNAPDWKVGGVRDLPIVKRDIWDGPGAATALLDAAHIGGDKPDYALARRGFVFHDVANPDLRSSYKDPFAVPENGELKAVSSAIGALARDVPRTDGVASLIAEAMKIVSAYQKKLAALSAN